MVFCQKGPTWQIGPFWQDTLDIGGMLWQKQVSRAGTRDILLCLWDVITSHCFFHSTPDVKPKKMYLLYSGPYMEIEVVFLRNDRSQYKTDNSYLTMLSTLSAGYFELLDAEISVGTVITSMEPNMYIKTCWNPTWRHTSTFETLCSIKY